MLTIRRRDASRNMARFYAVSLQVDLLDGWSVIRDGSGSAAADRAPEPEREPMSTRSKDKHCSRGCKRLRRPGSQAGGGSSALAATA
jgi:hypothetical protein